MFFNNLLILIFITAIIAAVIYYFKILNKVEVEEEFVNPYTIDYLTRVVSDTFSELLRTNLKEMNLSRKELEQKENTKNELRKALKEAAYGNRSARTLVLQYIKDIIRGPKGNISAETIDKVIPFGRSESLRGRDHLEICAYIYTKKYKKEGFGRMIDDYGLNTPKKRPDANTYYEISADDMKKVHSQLITEEALSYQDKLNIVAQRIFAQYKGFGVADPLFETNIDEIDCGVSGIPETNIDFSAKSKEEIEYSYDSIWIMYRGINIKMSCISFETYAELKRICSNIYKYNPPAALSQINGRVVSTMADGSRIVVVRPPVSDSWAFFKRGFDSVPSIAPEELFPDTNSIIPITIMKWMIRGYRNIAITGSQGSGKTTTLKSLIRFIPEDLTLRVQELAFELNLRFTYPKRNIVTFQETDTVTAQEELDLQKKTNGSVNIIGEAATAMATSWVVQSSMVASLFSFFTHHAKRTRDLIISFRNDLLQIAGFTNEKAAEELVVQVLNIDLHMEKIKGHRYCERITEIIPIKDRRYPSDIEKKSSRNDQLIEDTIEYHKRVTDRELYTLSNIVEWHNGQYYLMNMPSEEIINQIKDKLSVEEEAEFIKDIEMLKEFLSIKPEERVGIA